MIRRSGLRWRLAGFAGAAMLAVLAVVFVAVYLQTGHQLRTQVDDDAAGDVTQLVESVRTSGAGSGGELAAQLKRYIGDQPYRGRSSLLFAVIPGYGSVSNEPELLGAARPDDGESAAEQQRENAEGRRLLTGPVGQRTLPLPDVGPVRVDERLVTAAGLRVRVGAGESLVAVHRAQASIAGAFVIAGAIGVALVLLGAWLAGAVVSRPLRRMARVAGQVDDGDLHPRMAVPETAAAEVRVLAEAFNHMLDRLAAAFAHQRAFVADASHELRTPLTVIAGQLEVLAATRRPSARDIQTTQRLVAAEVARTARLVDDMLLLTRAEHEDFLRRASFPLDRFIADLWATTTAGRDRRLELGPVPAGTLDADPDRLAQALRNLIDNALAHTQPGGLVALDTQSLGDGWVRFVVSDDGPGIADEQRALVFERFHRTDEARDRTSGGAGLGLAIVRAIAEAHSGRVRAARAPRGGARLELELPRFERPRPDRPRPHESPLMRA